MADGTVSARCAAKNTASSQARVRGRISQDHAVDLGRCIAV